MSADCHDHQYDSGTSVEYKRVLVVVIFINALMFCIEMSFGVVGESQALKADALDFLGDSTTYALSLWAIGQSLRTRSNVALFKGVSLLLMAIWVLGSTLYHLIFSNNPSAPIMVSVALAALIANLICVMLLVRFRDGDANIRSVWLCTRNDAISNLLVLLAAVLVYASQSPWPDLLAALIIATLFTNSAWKIIKQARSERLALDSPAA